jgi:hypothetical protein
MTVLAERIRVCCYLNHEIRLARLFADFNEMIVISFRHILLLAIQADAGNIQIDWLALLRNVYPYGRIVRAFAIDNLEGCVTRSCVIIGGAPNEKVPLFF